jgi:PAS domain S-box-containing protein
MAAIHHHLDVITGKYNAKTDIIFSMRHIVRERALSTYAMFVMDDPFQREEEYQRFTNMAGEFIQLRDHLIQLGLTEKERIALDGVLEQVREYQPLHARLVDRITHEQTDGIREEILNHDLLRQRDMLDRLDKMVDMERSESRAAAVQASDEYRSAYLVMMLLTAAAIAFGLLVAGYVVRRARLIESALAQEKEHAEITLHSVGDAVIAADAQGKVSYLNPAAEQMTGWRSEEARGQPLSKIYHIINETTRKPLEHPAMLGVLDSPIVGLDKHTLLVSRSGMELAIEDTAAPIRNSDGEDVGAILVFRDVTEQRSMQNQLTGRRAMIR